MSLDIGWAVVKDLVGWIQQTRSAARGKREQRYARVIEHSGVLVAGLRGLNGRAERLVRPLVYFDASTWDQARREELTTQLMLFAHEEVILPRMRASLVALGPACNTLGDDEVTRPARRIFDITAELFEPRAMTLWVSPGSKKHRTLWRGSQKKSDLESVTTGDVLDAAVLGHRGDYVLGAGVLPDLIDRLRRAETDEDAVVVQKLATQLLDHGANYNSILAPHVNEAQSRFGELLTFQDRWFPAMPSPDWVWA